MLPEEVLLWVSPYKFSNKFLIRSSSLFPNIQLSCTKRQTSYWVFIQGCTALLKVRGFLLSWLVSSEKLLKFMPYRLIKFAILESKLKFFYLRCRFINGGLSTMVRLEKCLNFKLLIASNASCRWHFNHKYVEKYLQVLHTILSSPKI